MATNKLYPENARKIEFLTVQLLEMQTDLLLREFAQRPPDPSPNYFRDLFKEAEKILNKIEKLKQQL